MKYRIEKVKKARNNISISRNDKVPTDTNASNRKNRNDRRRTGRNLKITMYIKGRVKDKVDRFVRADRFCKRRNRGNNENNTTNIITLNIKTQTTIIKQRFGELLLDFSLPLHKMINFFAHKRFHNYLYILLSFSYFRFCKSIHISVDKSFRCAEILKLIKQKL